MSDEEPTLRENVGDFIRGVLDRIRDRCREIDPGGWKEIDECETEITGRQLKDGTRGIYIKETK